MPDQLANFWQVLLAVATLLATVVIAWQIYGLNRRQARASEQQAETALTQSLNTHDFELHKIFIENPKLRPYIYDENPSIPVEQLDKEEQQQLRAVVGFVLDFFHLIATMYANPRLRAHVDYGYVEWMQDSLATNTLFQNYLDEHSRWERWYRVLAGHRDLGLRQVAKQDSLE
jgi:hypothetical protein